MLSRSTLILFAALTVAVTPGSAQTYATSGGTVQFTSRVPLHTFTGTSRNLTGEINLGTNEVDFFVDLETLRTGIGRRDRDMRETLETDEHPFAEFTGRLLTSFDPSLRGRQQARVQGTFSIHGVNRPLTVTGTLEQTGSQIRLVADWEIRLDHYNIEPPRLLMVRVDQVQAVHIDALLSRR